MTEILSGEIFSLLTNKLRIASALAITWSAMAVS
jgi:hypothetical protein